MSEEVKEEVKKEVSFEFDVGKNVHLIHLLSVLMKRSRSHDLGVKRGDLYFYIPGWDDEGDEILQELVEKKLVTTAELQVGTAGIKDTFYKLVSSPIKLMIELKVVD